MYAAITDRNKYKKFTLVNFKLLPQSWPCVLINVKYRLVPISRLELNYFYFLFLNFDINFVCALFLSMLKYVKRIANMIKVLYKFRNIFNI